MLVPKIINLKILEKLKISQVKKTKKLQCCWYKMVKFSKIIRISMSMELNDSMIHAFNKFYVLVLKLKNEG